MLCKSNNGLLGKILTILVLEYKNFWNYLNHRGFKSSLQFLSSFHFLRNYVCILKSISFTYERIAFETSDIGHIAIVV